MARQSSRLSYCATEANKRDGSILRSLVFTIDQEPALIQINTDKALKWLHNGAQPTDTVKNLFTKVGINKQYAEAKIEAKKHK